MSEDKVMGTDAQLPTLDVAAQVEVPFLDELLLAAQGVDGDIYVPVTPFAQRLGMAQPRQQILRIRRDETMEEALRLMPLKTAGGEQDMQCLRIDMLTLWLATIRAAAVKEEIRPKLKQYKREAARAILAYFTMKVERQQVANVATVDPRLSALVEQYDTLMDVASFLREHMSMIAAMPGQLDTMSTQLDQAVTLLESLTQRQDETDRAVEKIEAKTQGLTPTQQAKVREAVEIIARDSAGLPSALDFAQVYAALKRRFQVGSYKQIPDSHYAEVMKYLRDTWKQATSGTLPEQGAMF